VKIQKEYREKVKAGLSEESFRAIVTVDFAQNYSPLVQDAIQGFHWTRHQTTVHPFYVEYYCRAENKLKFKCYVVISDELAHVTSTFYAFQSAFIKLLKEDFPFIEAITYLSDGSAAQYKNFKNFLNIVYHQKDFRIEAQWEFFPTAHGKGPCDGAAGSVKQSTRLESLRRKPGSPKIITPMEMFQFCNEKLSSATRRFLFVSKDDVSEHQDKLQLRYRSAKSVPGSRSIHSVRPLTETIAALRRYSLQEEADYFDFSKTKTLYVYPDLNEYCAVVFERNFEYGLVVGIDKIQEEIEVKLFIKGAKGG
jgi:hypothetical protein